MFFYATNLNKLLYAYLVENKQQEYLLINKELKNVYKTMYTKRYFFKI